MSGQEVWDLVSRVLVDAIPFWIIFLLGYVAVRYFGRFFDNSPDRIKVRAWIWPILLIAGIWHLATGPLRRRIPIWRESLDRRVAVMLSVKIHEDEFGELYHGPNNDGGQAAWLKVRDGTGSHIIRADPRANTAHEAVAASFGKMPEEYQPEAQS